MKLIEHLETVSLKVLVYSWARFGGQGPWHTDETDFRRQVYVKPIEDFTGHTINDALTYFNKLTFESVKLLILCEFKNFLNLIMKFF